MRRWYLAFSLILAASGATAQDDYLPDPEHETPLSAAEVTATFSGKTHRGSYNFKAQNFEGFHFEEWTSASGQVLHRMGARVDKGTWTQKDAQICFDYETTDLVPACFSFYQRGNCIYHYQQTVDENYAPVFTAVSVIKGEVPSCDPPLA